MALPITYLFLQHGCPLLPLIQGTLHVLCIRHGAGDGLGQGLEQGRGGGGDLEPDMVKDGASARSLTQGGARRHAWHGVRRKCGITNS